MLIIVDLPEPGAPYKTANLCSFLEYPETMDPIHHSILCSYSGLYNVVVSSSHAGHGALLNE